MEVWPLNVIRGSIDVFAFVYPLTSLESEFELGHQREQRATCQQQMVISSEAPSM
jgi:hypothetical protein